jgi:hypothetical protein
MIEINNSTNIPSSISIIKAPFPLVSVEGLYTEDEIFLIHQELDYLHTSGNLKSTGTGGNPDILNRTGAWINDVFKEPEHSSIHNVSRKIPELVNHIRTDEWFFSNMEVSSDNILVSYYTDGSHYEAHRDLSSITALYWTHKEPKGFSGGELHFPDHNITLPPIKGKVVLFPSCIPHEVLKVHQTEKDDVHNKYGRYTITNFMSL